MLPRQRSRKQPDESGEVASRPRLGGPAISSAIVAALVIVKQAGRQVDLQDRIADAWQAERERKLSRTIGESAGLASELQRFLKIGRQEADDAADEFLNRTYQQVAIEALLTFAAEISSPPRRREPESRVGDIEELRRIWNPYNGGLTWEEQHESAAPASKVSPVKRRRLA